MSDLGDYVSDALSAYDVVEGAALEVSDSIKSNIGAFATFQALRILGIELPLGGQVNQQTVTAAINRDVLGGEFNFSNLFDKAAVKADARRIAIEQAGALYGYDGGQGVEGLRRAVTAQVMAQVRQDIEAGAGDYIDAAADLSSALDAIAGRPREGWNDAKDLSPKGVSNRARQATYRAGHTKVWVPR